MTANTSNKKIVTFLYKKLIINYILDKQLLVKDVTVYMLVI